MQMREIARKIVRKMEQPLSVCGYQTDLKTEMKSAEKEFVWA